MSYTPPSVLVYQDLLNSGGVLNSTPDLEACIVGPAYNVLSYIPGDVASQIKTAAYSTSSTTGTIAADGTTLTVASTGGFSVDDVILVVGAGASGATLRATITNISGNVITIDTAASTAVTSAMVTKTGTLSNPLISNTYEIAGAKAGQLVESTSVEIWMDNAKVETLITGVDGYLGSLADSILTVTTPSTSPAGSLNSGSSSVTVDDPSGFVIGDAITIAGAGTAGATHTATISNIVGSVFTISSATVTTVGTTAAITKVIPTNLNSTTNTLRVEAGDEVKLSYTNTSAEASIFTSQVRSVVTSSGNNGTVVTMTMVDSLPSDLCYSTTGDTTASNTTITNVVSTDGVRNGIAILLKGAGTGGVDLNTTVVSFVADTSITVADAPSTTAVGIDIVPHNDGISVSVRKSYQDQLLAATRPISGGANYVTTNVTDTGEVTINANPEVSYGKVMSGEVYIGYRALRQDLVGEVLTFEDINDAEGQLGDLSNDNPLGLGVKIALANTTTRVRGIAVASNDLDGYLAALEAAEGERVYALTPLTQTESILTAFKAHVAQMSTPENAAWRVAIVNTAIPTIEAVGDYTEAAPNTNSGANTVTQIVTDFVLNSSNSTFITDGVRAGDMVHYGSGMYEVLEVVSNQQLKIDTSSTATAVEFYITRALSKTESAESVSVTAEAFGVNRVWYVQPDSVGISIDGVVTYLPGYYLACAVAGAVAGNPVQQGFTNMTIAGIDDLQHSNFYFSKANLNSMAESGVCLFVQDSRGGPVYCRHALTTDVTVYEYREQLAVKNWDWLSYFYYDKTKGFIGKWNITPETMNVIRQTLIASSEMVKAEKLPRIGAPLESYGDISMAQDEYNKDNLNVTMPIRMPSVLNYLNLHLVI